MLSKHILLHIHNNSNNVGMDNLISQEKGRAEIAFDE